MSRPSFTKVFLDFAEVLAQRSTCQRLHVGCVITSTDHRRVLGIGYNGNARGGVNDCDHTGPSAVGACGCVHAEMNALVNCQNRDQGKHVFVSHLPCLQCAKLLINLGGVERVVYRHDYRVKVSLEWLARASITTYSEVELSHISQGEE